MKQLYSYMHLHVIPLADSIIQSNIYLQVCILNDKKVKLRWTCGNEVYLHVVKGHVTVSQ